ncbi:MAG: hypothetical protein IT158_18680 [Bryobacterales bacterium]|nr:hypothetical protein [Bryobacterales bacterium]
MHRINWGRVIGGGLLAGVIIDIVEGLVSGMWLAQEWQQVMNRLGLSGEYSGAPRGAGRLGDRVPDVRGPAPGHGNVPGPAAAHQPGGRTG